MDSQEKIVVFGPALPMNLAPMWVAHDKGFFKEEGLDVDLRPVQGIPDSQHPRLPRHAIRHPVQPGAQQARVLDRGGPADQDQERRLEGILHVARVA